MREVAPIRVNAGRMKFPPDPAALLPVLRAPLRVVLAQAPERALTRLLAAALTHLLRGQALAGRLPELAGKHVSLLVSDLRRELRFRITPAGLASGWDAPGVGTYASAAATTTSGDSPTAARTRTRCSSSGA